MPDTPLRESQPRLPIDNFYYAQEDEVYTAAARDRLTWTVHRPHTDLDLGHPIEVMTDMANSRRLGFAAWQSTEDSFYDLFSELRALGLIP